MCEEKCITSGEDDDTSQDMDSDIKKIARMITDLNELAYNTYKPIVDDICARKAPGAEVEHLLDHMVGICHDDRMTELFKRVCRKYLYLYPEMITSEIYAYKEMYEDDDSTGANQSQVDDVEKIQCNMEDSERTADDRNIYQETGLS